jgi:hypothetical protein
METQQPQNPEPVIPTPPPQPAEEHHLSHTYQDDMNEAMNVTEAPIVQALLADARERQVEEEQAAVERTERKWYSVSSLFLLLLAVAVIAYGTYYYAHLTVPVTPALSVGVFPSTDNIVASDTTIQGVLTSLTTSTTLPVNKPTLVNIVSDSTTNTLLSDVQLYKFMDADVPEPLQSVISVARLGVVNTGTEVVPFIIATVPNPEKASQEFDIAEPNLLQMFATPLGIDMANYQAEVDQSFQSQYFYNIPVRSLTTIASITAPQTIIFLYGYINNNTIVITTEPPVLKTVYDTIINQL